MNPNSKLKMFRSISIFLVLILFLFNCSNPKNISIEDLAEDLPAIKGTTNYLNSPFVTTGNRVYMVGHQDGSFPELGWHIKGEMGGIWNHPIKLMDGFDLNLIWDDESISLNKAESFTNYPMANQHTFKIESKKFQVERFQFVPTDKQGIAIQFIIKNNNDSEQNFKLQFIGHSDLRPTWLGERSNMIDHEDTSTFNANLDAWTIKDKENPWHLIFGSDIKSLEQNKLESRYEGKGSANSITYKMSLNARQVKSITFVIAGSYSSEEDAAGTFNSIKDNWAIFFADQRHRYKDLANRSKLTVPDKRLEEAFEWLKYNCDWLVRTVPEIGTGITAGIPDYPWWFGVDSEYALKGYMAIGQTDAVYNTIELLDSISNATNGNGRIVHEVSTNGVVFNEGNINETPQFASLIWEVYKWNGDKAFLKTYFPTVKKGLEWLLKENDADNNLFPDGFGMMEIHGMDSEMIDVAAYTQRAFDDASKMALELGEEDLSKSYRSTADLLKDKINSEFWSEEFQSYADFIGTDQQALHLIEDAMVRADTLNKPWAVEELENTKSAILKNPSQAARPFVLHHNWVVNTPMEMKIADPDKALKALNTAEKFVNPFGVFVTGIDRDDSAGSDDGSFKGSKVFSYTGAVMTLPTGVQAVAENNYGKPDKALNYINRMTRTFSYALPGSMYEVSPDYGMMTQAWNIYSYAVPIVHQFFGIDPMASTKTVTIKPQMPSEWDEASLENVSIADNNVSIFFKNKDGFLNLKVSKTNPDWNLKIILPKEKRGIQWKVVESSEDHKLTGSQIIMVTSLNHAEIILKAQ